MNLEDLRAEDFARILLRVALIVLGVFVVIMDVVFFLFIMEKARQITDNAGPTAREALIWVLPLLAIGCLLVTLSRPLATLLYRPDRPAEGARPQTDFDPSAVCPSCGLPYSQGDYDSEATEWHCDRCGTRLGP